jgi:restriction system protein
MEMEQAERAAEMEAQRIARIAEIRAERIALARDLGSLLMVTPDEFERTVASLLAESGFTDVRVVGGSGDLAADVTCTDGMGLSVVVQCKQYAPHQKIGSPDIQKFIGMGRVHHRADRLIFVTTARFTEPAVALADEHDIKLVSGESLVGWARRLREVPPEASESASVI